MFNEITAGNLEDVRKGRGPKIIVGTIETAKELRKMPNRPKKGRKRNGEKKKFR